MPDPENLRVDTIISTLEWIINDLHPFLGTGGHFGCHLGFIDYLIMQSHFSLMCLKINIIQIQLISMDALTLKT